MHYKNMKIENCAKSKNEKSENFSFVFDAFLVLTKNTNQKNTGWRDYENFIPVTLYFSKTVFFSTLYFLKVIKARAHWSKKIQIKKYSQKYSKKYIVGTGLRPSLSIQKKRVLVFDLSRVVNLYSYIIYSYMLANE